jgi:hypothetical protein
MRQPRPLVASPCQFTHVQQYIIATCSASMCPCARCGVSVCPWNLPGHLFPVHKESRARHKRTRASRHPALCKGLVCSDERVTASAGRCIRPIVVRRDLSNKRCAFTFVSEFLVSCLAYCKASRMRLHPRQDANYSPESRLSCRDPNYSELSFWCRRTLLNEPSFLLCWLG